jgi:hypothetical protein
MMPITRDASHEGQQGETRQEAEEDEYFGADGNSRRSKRGLMHNR